MKITIRSWFGAKMEVIENVSYSDMQGKETLKSGFVIKNKSFDIEVIDPVYFKKVLYERLKKDRDIIFFVVGNGPYKLLAFYDD